MNKGIIQALYHQLNDATNRGNFGLARHTLDMIYEGTFNLYQKENSKIQKAKCRIELHRLSLLSQDICWDEKTGGNKA